MNKSDQSLDIRPSAIAGTWYPGSAELLSQSIDDYLDNSPSEATPGQILGIVVPHAGHQYSGAVAARAFVLCKDLTPELVVVVSPIHSLGHGQIVITAHDAYETPLGVIPVSRSHLVELESKLVTDGGIQVERIRNDSEHSLEIELPFLQRILNTPFKLLPVMVRDQSIECMELLGTALAELVSSDSALFVASSDLSHFYPEETAQRLDSEVLSRVAAYDPAGVLQAEAEGKGFACGRGAIAAVLWATKKLGGNRVHVLHRTSSGEITADYASVVGYGAAVILNEA